MFALVGGPYRWLNADVKASKSFMLHTRSILIASLSSNRTLMRSIGIPAHSVSPAMGDIIHHPHSGFGWLPRSPEPIQLARLASCSPVAPSLIDLKPLMES